MHLGTIIVECNPKEVPYSELILLACVGCSNMFNNYHCPPYVPPASLFFKKVLQEAEYCYVVASYYDLASYIVKLCDKCRSIIQALTLASKIVDSRSYWVHNSIIKNVITLAGNKTVAVLGSGGGCRICPTKLRKPCGAVTGEPCRFPKSNLAFPSPESHGIFVYKLAKMLDIPIEIPPRAFVTRIGIIFTKTKLMYQVKQGLNLPTLPTTVMKKLEELAENDKHLIKRIRRESIHLDPTSLQLKSECQKCKHYHFCIQLLRYVKKLTLHMVNVCLYVAEYGDPATLSRALVRTGVCYATIPISSTLVLSKKKEKVYPKTICGKLLGLNLRAGVLALY